MLKITGWAIQDIGYDLAVKARRARRASPPGVGVGTRPVRPG